MNQIPKKPEDAIWNDEQWQAIYESGHDLLISAGAGSGKTAVLVERIIQKILRHDINVDELLVLTFTEAAAAEMKQRIRGRIEQELAKDATNFRLNMQLNKISSAYISTFHSFCNKLIRRYYYLLNLDPVFKIADDIEVGILQDDVIENLFDEWAETEDEHYEKLSECFNNDRHEEALKTMILKIYELARSNPEMMDWLGQLSSLYEWDERDLSSWRYYHELNMLMTPLIDEAMHELGKARQFTEDAEVMGVEHPYKTEIYGEDMAYIERIKASQQSSYQELREAVNGTKLRPFPRKNAKKYDEVAHEKGKDARAAFKKHLDKIGENYLVYSNETHLKHFKYSASVVQSLAILVVRFHEQFMIAKRERQLLDFSDLEWNTLRLLVHQHQPTEVAKEVYHQFKEIMVDEYQDTNSMQESILTAIAKAFQPEIPIFMVGDVKQSIYRFRLAEPSIFQNKYRRYSLENESGNKIDLMKNYRSHQQVIDATNFIFKQIMDERVGEIEYDEAAMLRLGVDGEENIPFNQSEIHLLDKKAMSEENEEDLTVVELEAEYMAKQIQSWLKEGQQVYDRKKGEYRFLEYQDIVILMRSLSHVTTFQDVFRKYHIPLFTEQNTDLFDSSEIINLISCLKVIDNPYQDIPLVGLMRSPFFFFDERELAMIKVANKETSFYDLVLSYRDNGSDELLKQKVSDFIELIESWRFKSKTVSLSQLITHIYEQTLYYEFVLGLPHGYLRKANLDVFVDKARAYEQSTKKGLYGFVNYIERMQELGKHFGKAKTVTANENVVRIMSIHKSKGLEFPVVFVSQIHKKFNVQDERGDYLIHKKYGVAVKYIDPKYRLKQKTIAQNVVASMIHKEMLAEEMRLLYVAMTRAQSKLIFTGVVDASKKISQMNEIIEEANPLLPAYYRLKAQTYLDWLLPAVLRHKDSKKIVEEYTEAKPLFIEDGSSWCVKIINQNLEDIREESVVQIQQLTPPTLNLNEIFNRTYKHQALVSINAKQSVSERKEIEHTPLFKGIPENREKVPYDRPSFMKENQVSGVEAGTALHQFMQYLPIQAEHSLESLTDMRERLIEKEMMTEAMADKINLEQVLAFTKTELYQSLRKASTIKKEAPFMTLIHVDEHEEAEVLLQGVIDLLAEFEDEVWIIDYKTDYVRDFERQYEELKQRYAVQMKYYLKAMKEIYPTKKVCCYVYFLKVEQTIKYE